ncbi:SRPBCC family protein [Streptacidiphilus monticola]|jgi:uncharacterized protein YndB with AHSA1/START domain|uniref:SRPBCC family protein n=1 Tax=Streptacidiphilus monticola TaxID=2161674 RepID=A0ABW1G939_9ACTN
MQASKSEYGSIEREIHIEASPEVVYEVISTPEHLREWWPDEAEFESVVGGTGQVVFGEKGSADAQVSPLTVVEADPPKRFAIRWVYDEDEAASPTNSLLVTFDLVPTDTGTLLRFSEQGFRERGWEAALLEEQYRDHVTGWDYFLPRLVAYAAARQGSVAR